MLIKGSCHCRNISFALAWEPDPALEWAPPGHGDLYTALVTSGLLATLLLLTIVGWVASWIGARPALRLWDHLLTRIPGIGILYGSTKSLGEAFFADLQAVVPSTRGGRSRAGRGT